jgi:hypothetical protein
LLFTGYVVDIAFAPDKIVLPMPDFGANDSFRVLGISRKN